MFEHVDDVLDDFSKEVVRLSRRNLNLSGFAKKGRKIDNTKSLSNGLGYKIKKGNTGTLIEFTSKEDYAAFIDSGVNGTKIKWNAPFGFKGKFANIGAIEKYVKSPKVKLRKTFINKSGQKVSQMVQKNDKNIKSAAFAMARSIAANGIKPTKFFTEAINEAYDNLPPKLEEAFVKDAEDILFKDFQNNPNLKLK